MYHHKNKKASAFTNHCDHWAFYIVFLETYAKIKTNKIHILTTFIIGNKLIIICSNEISRIKEYGRTNGIGIAFGIHIISRINCQTSIYTYLGIKVVITGSTNDGMGLICSAIIVLVYSYTCFKIVRCAISILFDPFARKGVSVIFKRNKTWNPALFIAIFKFGYCLSEFPLI